MIETLARGFFILRSHSKLWLVLAFAVLFPVVFLSFYISDTRASEANLSTVILKKITAVHDATEVAIISGVDLDLWLKALRDKQDDITRFEIVVEDAQSGDLSILLNAFSEDVGEIVDNTAAFKSALIEPGTTYIYQYVVGDSYREQAFRAVRSSDGRLLYIFTEHDFTLLYNLFKARANKPILLLGALFIFLLLVAYWLARQINYEDLHTKATATLKERDTFTSSLVHELRAPLTAMRGYASMIEESGAVPLTEREYATKIRQSTSRLVALVNDFLEAARIQSGQLPITISSCDAAELLERVVGAAQPNALEKKLVLALRLPGEVVQIETDAKRLEQILTNIVSNAIKYTAAGSVTLSLKKDFRSAIFTIADTGSGISAEDQRKLFNPFVRVGDKSQMEQVTGTGLGMWITRQLVSQLSGSIEIESIKDVGTHVIIKLPLHNKK
jgi:signal transduction histidine kinase